MIAAFVAALALAQQPPQKFAFEKEIIEVPGVVPEAGDFLIAGKPRSNKGVLIGADYFTMKELYKYMIAGDDAGIEKLTNQKRASVVEPGVVKVIKVHDYRQIGGEYLAEIRFDKGPYADRTVFAAAADLGLYVEQYKELPIEFYARKMEVKSAGVAIAVTTPDLAESLASGKVRDLDGLIRQGKGIQLMPKETYTVERTTKQLLILKVESSKKKRDVYIHPKFVRPTDDTVAKYRESMP